MFTWVGRHKTGWASSIAAGTYFEQGGLRNKTGGGWSRDKSDARHYDPKAQLLLIKVSFIHLIQASLSLLLLFS